MRRFVAVQETAFLLLLVFGMHVADIPAPLLHGGPNPKTCCGTAWALRPLGKFPNANLHLEINHEWARRDEEEGSKLLDSGGTTLYITPGISVSPRSHVSLFCAMPIPVYQNLGGQHEEIEYQILAGINRSV